MLYCSGHDTTRVIRTWICTRVAVRTVRLSFLQVSTYDRTVRAMRAVLIQGMNTPSSLQLTLMVVVVVVVVAADPSVMLCVVCDRACTGMYVCMHVCRARLLLLLLL